MIAAFAAASGKEIPYQIAARRPGDIAVCFADPAKAWRELGWRAERGLREMCDDAWRWQVRNPEGY
jgi:UDP-glucose 4-epimerase